MTRAGLDLGWKRAAYVRLEPRGDKLAVVEAALVTSDAADEADDAERVGALCKELRDAGVSAGAIHLDIPGRDAILRYLHLPVVPPWRLKLLLADEAAEVAEKAGASLSSDFRLLQLPDDMRTPAAEPLSVLTALAKEPPLEARIDALAARGFDAQAVMPTAIALVNAYVGLGHVDADPVVLVDAGPDGTEVAVVRHGLLIFARSLPPLAQGAESLTVSEAAELARGVAGALALGRSQQKLKPFEPSSVRLSGAHATAGPLARALETALKTPVEPFDPLDRLDVTDIEGRRDLLDRGPELVLAVGLAVTGMHPRTLDLDLLPSRARARRAFRTRTVWMYAAGALVAATLLFSVGRALMSRSAAEARLGELKSALASLDARTADLAAQRERNRSVLAVLNGLGGRTRTGAALLSLLELLRGLTPQGITIVSLEAIEVATPKEDDAAQAVHFVLQGEADDAAGDAGAVLSRFEASLKAAPEIRDARVTGTPEARPGATVGFSLAIEVRAGSADPRL